MEIIKNKIDKIRNKHEKKEKCKLYIYRFYADGTLSNSKPCAECSRWLTLAEWVGVIYQIYYTNEKSILQPYHYDCTQYLPHHTYFNI
jgi:hypothetical protein